MSNKIKKATEVARELLKLLTQVEKIVIQMISLVGWIAILIHILQ